METIYTLLFTLSLPCILLRLWWRGRRSPGYRQKVPERLGYYSTKKMPSNTLWLHAVSYGEAVAAEPLIAELLKRYPDRPLLITTMTPTGAARIAQRFGDKVIHQYIPYDLPGPTKRFMEHNQPSVGIIMETELWPNLLKACSKFQVPILLANARLSEKSHKNYYRIKKLTKKMLDQIDIIAAQSELDASRFAQLGADSQRLTTCGNIKFDVAPRPDLCDAGLEWRKHCADRPLWMAASTHPGEEEQVFSSHQAILKQFPSALLILAPRHTDRVEQVVELCRNINLSVERYTQNECPSSGTQVFIVDVMGQLPKFYRAAEIAFVGGSLMPIGGHNIIETASAQAAIIVGPHMHNFTAVADEFKQAQASTLVTSSDELAKSVLDFLQNTARREKQIQLANVIVEKNSGALEKLLKYTDILLKTKKTSFSGISQNA